MSRPDASEEMPGLPFPRQPAMPLDESLLDALLTGTSLPPDAPEQVRRLADLLASIADPAAPGALTGEAAARAAFARGACPAAMPPARGLASWRSPRRLAAFLATRLAAVLAAVAIGLGGVAAAYADVLPAPIQDFAHAAIGAPAAHRPAGTRRTAGPRRRSTLPVSIRLPSPAMARRAAWLPGTARRGITPRRRPTPRRTPMPRARRMPRCRRTLSRAIRPHRRSQISTGIEPGALTLL